MVSHTGSLSRLIYYSRQTPAVVENLDLEVRRIIRHAECNNREVNVTGLLVPVQGLFIQVLEGSPSAVQTIYGRVVNDTRHTNPVVLSAGPAPSRLFQNWNMCARSIAPSDKAILDVIDAKGPFDPARMTPAIVLRFLKTVANIQRRTASSVFAG